MSPALPVSCIAVMACIDTPVAPIGWPLAFSPPDGLIGSLPSFWRPAFGDDARALPFGRQAHRLVFDQFGDGEAVMGFGKGQVGERDAGLLQRALPGDASSPRT